MASIKSALVSEKGKAVGLIDGTAGKDKLSGGNGSQVINGLGGDDILSGGNDDDRLFGGAGNDSLAGDNQNDLLEGGAGHDRLGGGNQDDVLRGGDGNDILSGDNGDDLLDGGTGTDLIDGGNGNDALIFVAGGTGYRGQYSGGLGTDKLSLFLTSGQFTPQVREQLIEFLNWLASGQGGSYRINALGLDVEQVETLELRVDGQLVDLRLPPNAVVDAVADGFSADEDGSVQGDVGANDVPSSGSGRVFELISGVERGILSFSSNGSFRYDASGLDALAAGEITTANFTYEIRDAGGQSDRAVVTVTIKGVNDPASMILASGADQSLREDQDGSASGSILVTDPDTGQARIDVGTPATAAYGQVTLSAGGGWSYQLQQGHAAVQGLGVGDSLVDRFTIRSADGTGNILIEVTIAGTNDLAVISEESGADRSVTEDADQAASGRLIVADVDAGEALIDPASLIGANYGQVTIGADGRWDYQLRQSDAAVQALKAGETLVDSFTVRSLDGTGVKTVQITIGGANDTAAISQQSGADRSVTEDGDGNAQGRVIVTDADAGQARIDIGAPTGAAYGQVTLAADGAWSYQLQQGQAAVQALGAGDTLVDRFTIKSADGTASTQIEVIVTGANDLATISEESGADRSVTEDADQAASGRLLVVDRDSGEALIDPQSATTPLHGSFVIAPDGSWSYTLDQSRAAVQNLREGQILADPVTVRSIDGTTYTIAIQIVGRNDAPVLVGIVPDQQASVGLPFSLEIPDNLFSDRDAGDRLSFSAKLSDGASLPDWLIFNAETGTFSGTPSSGDSGRFTIALSATDLQGANASDIFHLDVSGALPAAASIRLAASDTTESGHTSASVVTLVGRADPSVRINLLDEADGEILATTISDATGQFRLSGIDMAVGANDFVVEAVNPENNLSSQSDEYIFVRDPVAPGSDPNAAIFWNILTLGAIAASGSTPAFATRALAMESQAVYNVIAAIEGTPGFQFNSIAEAGASIEAAIAQAAHDILVHLFPGQAGMLGLALSQRLDGIGEGLAAGLALGSAVADQVIALRANDGWSEIVTDLGSEAPGQWQPTGPFYMSGETPQWAQVDTFLLDDASQFRPVAPPSVLHDTVTNDQYASDLERTLRLGRASGSDRTADQEAIARFWADGTGTFTPPGHWNAIATQIASEKNIGLSATAELLLKLNLAQADAAIATWDAKYAYDVWRPFTVAQEGAVIDGVTIAADSDWRPLLNTPAHPDYVSGHSTFSAVGAAILTDFFGEDVGFSITTSSIPGGTVIRHFDSFWDAALEAGQSRIYAGIHWESSNHAGRQLGIDIAEHVLRAFDATSDVSAPRLTLSDPRGLVSATPAQISGFVTDNLSGVTQFFASIDGGDFVAAPFSANGAFTLSTLFAVDGSQDGLHEIVFVIADAAGNKGLVEWDFVLATQAPDILLAAGSLGPSAASIDAASRLIGRVDLIDGNRLAALSYTIDGRPSITMAFREDGSFDTSFAFEGLGAGAHQIVITAVDLAGNVGTETLSVTAPTASLLTITDLTPDESEGAISLHYRPLIEFSEAVDVSTLNENSLFATDSSGATLAMRIVPLENGKGAWMFFEDDLPASQAITLHVDGNIIATASGKKLDADGDGAAGGDLSRTFTTLSDTPVPGTSVTGRILDPGADLVPMTPDDFRAGPEGATDWDGNLYKNPLAGVKVYVMGREDEAVFTDAQGNFTLTSVPAGTIKIVVDGRTATNAPSGSFFPEMVMDVKIRPGVENTIMSGMGDREAQIDNIGNVAVYLPRIPTASLVELSDTEPTTIMAVTGAGSTQSAEQLGQMSLTVQPGSLVDAQGNPVDDAQVGIALVPIQIVANMFPTGVFQQAATITIQAPGGAVFTQEATLTMPNIYGLAPGEQTFILSFDHTTGKIVVDGTATVSADGKTITSDPGSGIDQPGWHTITGPAAGIGGDGPPPPCPPAAGPPPITNADITEGISELTGDANLALNIAEDFGVPVNEKLGKGLGLASTLSGLADTNNKVGSVMDDIANAYYAGDTNGLGAPDASYYAIKGTQLLGLTAKGAWQSGTALLGFVPGFDESPAGNTLKALDYSLAAAEKYGESVNAIENAVPGAKLAKKVRDQLTNPPAPKPAAGPGPGPNDPPPPPPEDPFEELDEATDKLEEAIEKAEELAEETKQRAEDLKKATQKVKDLLSDLESPPAPGEPELSTEELIDLIDSFDPETGELKSEFLDAVQEMLDAAADIAELGSIFDAIEEIAYWYEVVVAEYSEAFGDVPPELGEDTHGPDDSETYTYQYNDVLYGAAINVETREIVRFSFASNGPWEVFLDPETTYELYFFDPASGYVGATITTTGVSGNRNRDFEAPMLMPDGGEILANGLTATASMIVGANPDVRDSLAPGSGVSDAEALISGVADSPQLLTQTGPIGAVDLLGEALAVELTGSGGNGAGQTAFVATGSHGLAIVGLGNPALPVILSQTDLPGNAVDVAASETMRIVAVALGTAGVAVLDVSNPVVPRMLYQLDVTAPHIEMMGNDRFVVASGRQATIYDLTTGAVLQQFDLLPVSDDAIVVSLYWDGSRLLAVADDTDFDTKLLVVQTSDNLFDRVSQVDLGIRFSHGFHNEVRPNAIGVSGDIVYVGLNARAGINNVGLVSVDISNPGNLVILDRSSTAIAGDAVALNGSGLGISAASIPGIGNVVDVFNVRNPADADAFVQRFSLTPGASDNNLMPRDIAVAGRFAVVARGEAGLQILTYAQIDTGGIAPTIVATGLPDDADPLRPGHQVLEATLLNLGATVTDDVLVRSVDMMFNGVVVASDNASRFGLAAYLPTLAGNGGGGLTIQLRAIDTAGNVGLSSPILLELIVDPVPFGIVSIAPDPGTALAEGRNFIEVTFSRALDPIYVALDRFSLTSDSGVAVAPDAMQLLDRGTRLRLTFDIVLLEDGEYSFALDTSGLYDRAGHVLGNSIVTTVYSVSDADVTWVSAASGFWDVPGNWSTGSLPGGDQVVLVAPSSGTQAQVRNNVGSVDRLEVEGLGELSIGGTDPFGAPPPVLARLQVETLVNQGRVVLIDHGEFVVSGDILNEGLLSLTGSAGLTVGGNIVNNGGLFIGDPVNRGESNGAGIRLTGASTRITGDGEIKFYNSTEISGLVIGGVVDKTLTLVGQLISGNGEISGGLFVVVDSESIIRADDEGFSIYSGHITNHGSIEAKNGGTIVIGPDQFHDVVVIDNDGGQISIDGSEGYIFDSEINGGTLLTFGNGYRGPSFFEIDFSILRDTTIIVSEDGEFSIFKTRVEGGSLTSMTGGFFSLARGTVLSGVDNPVRLSGDFFATRELTIEGSIVNMGYLDSSPANTNTDADIMLSDDVTLSGGGMIFLGDDLPRLGYIGTRGAYTLTNVDNWITGYGLIGTLPPEGNDYASLPQLTFINEAEGFLENAFGGNMTLNHLILDNFGSLWASNGGLVISRSTVTNHGEIDAEGGTITVDALTTFVNQGNIWIYDNGRVDLAGSLSGSGSIFIYDGTLSFDAVLDQRIDVSGGQALIEMGSAASFEGILEDFAAGDRLKLDGMLSTATIDFDGGEDGGTLTLSDGTRTLSFFLRYEDQDELLINPEAHFFLASDNMGGLILTTDIIL